MSTNPNGLPFPFPIPQGFKTGIAKDERKEMYMQLLQGKMEDVQAIKRLKRQELEDHDIFIK
jgi:hypothetical protein